MNLYLVSRNDRVDYDEYDSAVVAAATPLKAKEWGCGTQSITPLSVEYIGKAKAGTKEGWILQSFNAG